MTAATADGVTRCAWTGIADPLYSRYHDEEWGVPHADDRRMLEKLTLEGFQSGLSWLTILKKRENFRKAFHGFDAAKVARFGERDIARLLADAGIVRHRLKIEAAIANAKAYLKLIERQSLASLVWSAVDGKPLANRWRSMSDIPPQTPQSKALSKALKAAGFRFVGPTTVYAFMQSTGLVNDHLVGCHRHAACARIQRGFSIPDGGAP